MKSDNTLFCPHKYSMCSRNWERYSQSRSLQVHHPYTTVHFSVLYSTWKGSDYQGWHHKELFQELIYCLLPVLSGNPPLPTPKKWQILPELTSCCLPDMSILAGVSVCRESWCRRVPPWAGQGERNKSVSDKTLLQLCCLQIISHHP